MSGPYLNDPGYEVPSNTILVVPENFSHDGFYKEVISPLRGEVKRDWFNNHYYHCLPLNIGSQYGFIIRAQTDFDMTWDGSFDNIDDIIFDFHDKSFLDENKTQKQKIISRFGNGVVTVQNKFALKTPPGINLMTIQPPNMFLPGCVSLTAVIETDQIRRDFTFNIKITIPNFTVKVKKGDPLGAFIPIPRYFVDQFDVKLIREVFPRQLHVNEIKDANELGRQRREDDLEKPHRNGRKYYNGIHAFGDKFSDHQKKID